MCGTCQRGLGYSNVINVETQLNCRGVDCCRGTIVTKLDGLKQYPTMLCDLNGKIQNTI